jgi:vacuolar-type H+-ATPase subunit H
MSSAIEQTVKALVEFEAALDQAKADVVEAKRRAMKDALDWAEAARSTAVAEANEIATRRVTEAKAAAEEEAKKIREKGESDLRAFESSIARHRAKAAEFAASRLMGESK